VANVGVVDTRIPAFVGELVTEYLDYDRNACLAEAHRAKRAGRTEDVEACIHDAWSSHRRLMRLRRS
jgi:hypothetical protein